MKQFLRKQLLNIVFLALIVAGALTIYLFSRAERSSISAERIASPTPTAETPAPTASAPLRPKGVPEHVFTTHLSASELFDAEVSADHPYTWELTYGEQTPVTTTLNYTLDGGSVTSLELAFLLPPEYDSKSKSMIEQYLAKSEGRVREAREEAVRALLPDLLSACDRNDALSPASIRIWTEEALNISSADDDYTQKSDGCTFYAYQMQRDGRDVLVCLFFLEA